jgi:hypothetical protein
MAGEQTKFTTSFIPKKPVIQTVANYKPKSNIVSIITIAIFLGTVVFGVGLFVYKLSIEKIIDSHRQTLERANQEFDPNFIKEATRLNTKMISVKKLLDNHQSPSAIFKLLENNTLNTVKFNNMRYNTDKNKGQIFLEADGLGLGYQSIVLQSDEFGKTGTLKDVVFSSIQSNESGLVAFSFKSQVDPQFVLYRKNLALRENDDSGQVSINNIFK